MKKVTVKKIIFRNNTNFNTIFLDDSNQTYIGYFPTIHAGFSLNISCISENNSSYNKEQFKVLNHDFPILDDSSLESFLKDSYFLSNFSNKTQINPSTTKKIINAIGINYLNIYTNREAVIKQLDAKKDNEIVRDVNSYASNLKALQKGYATYNFLINYGMSPEHSSQVAFSEYFFSEKEFLERPYKLLEFFDFPWSVIDQLSIKNGISNVSTIRKKSAILHSIQQQAVNFSNICAPAKQVYLEIENLLGYNITEDEFDKLVIELYKVGEINKDNDDNLYLKRLFDAENKLALNILRLNKAKNKNDIEIAETAFSNYQKLDKDISLSESQNNAVSSFLHHHLSILLGPAGSGKTTTLKEKIELIRIIETENHKKEKSKLSLDDYINNKIILIAPTGMAKQRMKVTTGLNAQTIHSLLALSPVYKNPRFNENYRLDKKYIFVDEFSMVDTELCAKLFEAIDDKATVVLIGDDDQLPSIGPGKVLKEMLEIPDLHIMRLDSIFRQGEGSQIIELSQKIKKEEAATLYEPFDKKGDELLFIGIDNTKVITDYIKNIFENLLNNDYVDIYKDTQIIIPMNKGDLGTKKINQELQLINLKKHGLKPKANTKFYLYDKVMQTRNDTDKNVNNGEIGKVIISEGSSIVVDFGGKKVSYNKQEVNFHLELCFATTIHKMQGSESDTIILIVHGFYKRMLEKSLLYTAVTRAKKKLIIIGDYNAFANGILVDKVSKRKSFILLRIEENELEHIIESRTKESSETDKS